MSQRFHVSGFTVVVLCVLCAHPPAVGGQGAGASPASLTLTIKGSTAYAKPAPVVLQTALLVVTPMWEDVKAVTEVGGREASGQPLFMSELAVVLSNRAMDCTSVFAATSPAGDQDVLIVAGKSEAYLAAKGWPTTMVGKVFSAATEAGTAAKLAVDSFSYDAQNPALKKKFSKDGVKGSNGRLVLEQTATGWRADFAVKSDDVTAEGQIPLTLCPVASRKKAAGAPLLMERRLMDAARNF